MHNIRTLHLQILEGRLSAIAGELTHFGFRSRPGRPPWVPRINVYRCTDRIVVCVELAGIERGAIDLRVEPRRVHVYGWRQAPQPADPKCPTEHILALEIDDGPCEREIFLPDEILPEEVRAEQRNGILWIELPRRSSPSASP